ncbi:MAG TPA: DNA-processing protein DprA [Bdellovibrionales bacterium]|nr:DNA-processing protein DprA [Bdellovibrionales bacterium]
MLDPRAIRLLAAKTPLLTSEILDRLGAHAPFTPRQVLDAIDDSNLRAWLLQNPAWPDECSRALEWLDARGARLTHPGLADYPAGLLELEDPPLALTYFGAAFWRDSRLLSVVGSRAPEPRALTWMELELAPLVRKGTALVSGGARGIDQRAHAICVRACVPTAAFLPSGLAKPYPGSFDDWIRPIIEAGGAVLSELDPFCDMRKHYFLKRNRLIAAMASVTLVIEARRQSGTMITARLAGSHGSTVAVVPGPAGDPRWAGSLDLLCAGAMLVRDAHDLRLLLDGSGAPGGRARPF